MPILTSGNGVTLTVAEQEFVHLNNGASGNARLEVVTGANAGAVVAVGHSGARLYGPFGAGTLSLQSVSGDCIYTQSTFADVDGFSREVEWEAAEGRAIKRPDGTLFGTGSTVDAIKRQRRLAWSARVAKLMAQHPPVVNPTPGVVNTFKFVNPQAAFNGNGDGVDDAASGGAAGAYNVLPTQVANTSYLFLEGSTYTVAAGGGSGTAITVTAAGVLFGTYARGSNAAAPTRVYDLGRVAKLNANACQRGFASASTGNWVVSGLEVYGCSHATQPEGISLGTVTSGSGLDCVAEYVYVHSLATTTSTYNGCGIQNRSSRGTVRFCRVRAVNHDGINSTNSSISGAGEHPQMYGNDIVLVSADGDNPDGMQMSHGTAMKSLRCEANWIDVSAANVKQGLIINDTGHATHQGGFVGHNTIIASDVSVLAPLSSGVNQRAVQISVPNIKFWGNVTIGGEYGLFVDPTGQCDARGNVHYMNASGGSQTYTQIGMNFSTGTASTSEHNTVVLVNPVSGSFGIVQSGANVHVSNGNIIVGPWEIGIRKATNGTEAYNLVHGAVIPVSNSSNVKVSPAASSITSNPRLAELLQPLTEFDAVDYTAFDSDVYGNPYRGAIGAVQ